MLDMSVSAAVAESGASLAFEIEYVDQAGEAQRRPLSLALSIPFEFTCPVRAFPSLKGQSNFPGLWWAATTGCHVGYESWVERSALMLMDFDPQVIGLSSQPFWLRWHDGRRTRRHPPDFFARLADGTGVVVDVRPDDLVDAKAAEVFAVTAEACRHVGWMFRRVGVPDPVMAANVRWLAGYRHPRFQNPAIGESLVSVLAEPRELLAAADLAGERLAVLPVLYHLMWRQVITADLAGALLGPGTVVALAEGAASS